MIVPSQPLTRVEAAPNTNGMRVNLDVSSRAAVLAPATVTRMGDNDWFATTMAQRDLTGSQRRAGAYWDKACNPIGVVRRAAKQIKHRARPQRGGATVQKGWFLRGCLHTQFPCTVLSFYGLRPICVGPKGVGPEMMICPYCGGERAHNPDNCPNCGESPPPLPPKPQPKPEFVFRSTRGRNERKA